MLAVQTYIASAQGPAIALKIVCALMKSLLRHMISSQTVAQLVLLSLSCMALLLSETFLLYQIQRSFMLKRLIPECMLQFRSISYGLFGTEAYHKAVRRKAVQYMRDHQSDFEAFVGNDMDGWLKEMSQHESWGDELTLVSAGIMLWCPCHYPLHTRMISCQGNHAFCHFSNDTKQQGNPSLTDQPAHSNDVQFLL